MLKTFKKERFIITILLTYLFIHFYMIVYYKDRGEVWHLNNQAINSLLHFQNPYTQNFRGAIIENKDLYPYFPFVLIFLLPFYLLGEIAFGNIFANIIAILSIYSISRSLSRKESMIPMIFSLLIYLCMVSAIDFFFFTRTISDELKVGINGTTTMIGVSLLLMSIALLKKNKFTQASIIYGLSLASLQFTSLLLPFFFMYYYTKRKVQYFLISLILFSLIIIPFVLVGFDDFIRDALSFQLTRTTYYLPLNLSLNGFSKTLFNVEVPLIIRIIIVFVFFLFFMKMKNDYLNLIRKSAIFSFLTLFILLNNLFLNYLLLPISLFLIIFPEHIKLSINKLRT